MSEILNSNGNPETYQLNIVNISWNTKGAPRSRHTAEELP